MFTNCDLKLHKALHEHDKSANLAPMQQRNNETKLLRVRQTCARQAVRQASGKRVPGVCQACCLVRAVRLPGVCCVCALGVGQACAKGAGLCQAYAGRV